MKKSVKTGREQEILRAKIARFDEYERSLIEAQSHLRHLAEPLRKKIAPYVNELNEINDSVTAIQTSVLILRREKSLFKHELKMLEELKG